MRLRILLPDRALIDELTPKVLACAADGWFCLLPRHADYVTALVPGILVFLRADGAERFAACDEALLVKVGNDVRVSTPKAAIGDDLRTLQRALETELLTLDEESRRARSALARLEASALRSFIELERRGRV